MSRNFFEQAPADRLDLCARLGVSKTRTARLLLVDGLRLLQNVTSVRSLIPPLHLRLVDFRLPRVGLGGVTAKRLECLEGTRTERTLYCANGLGFLADSLCFGWSLCFSSSFGAHRFQNLDGAGGDSRCGLGKLDGSGLDYGWLIMGVFLGLNLQSQIGITQWQGFLFVHKFIVFRFYHRLQ